MYRDTDGGRARQVLQVFSGINCDIILYNHVLGTVEATTCTCIYNVYVQDIIRYIHKRRHIEVPCWYNIHITPATFINGIRNMLANIPIVQPLID